MAKYQAFKNFSKRILVATDLFGRGMDIERVNIVFNYDMPENSDTYLHRVITNLFIKIMLPIELFFYARLLVPEGLVPRVSLSPSCLMKTTLKC